jgi:hypothetical protein
MQTPTLSTCGAVSDDSRLGTARPAGVTKHSNSRLLLSIATGVAASLLVHCGLLGRLQNDRHHPRRLGSLLLFLHLQDHPGSCHHQHHQHHQHHRCCCRPSSGTRGPVCAGWFAQKPRSLPDTVATSLPRARIQSPVGRRATRAADPVCRWPPSTWQTTVRALPRRRQRASAGPACTCWGRPSRTARTWR